jgi:hypothetical protein
MRTLLLAIAALILAATISATQKPVFIPQMDGEPWQIAGMPDLGKYNLPDQLLVVPNVWQAADGTWQLWVHVRDTAAPGKQRVLYRWEGAKLTDKNWQPKGIPMEADPRLGEIEGGLKGPFVMKSGSEYLLFYSAYSHIAMAKSVDGKTFTRQLRPDGTSVLFAHGVGDSLHDTAALRVGDLFYVHYRTISLKEEGEFLRTSKDLRTWSQPKRLAPPGSFSLAPNSSSLNIYFHKPSGYYYLLRTAMYGRPGCKIYRTKDPSDFGVGDQYLVGTFPYLATQIVEDDGQIYLVTMTNDQKGIQIGKLKWVPRP